MSNDRAESVTLHQITIISKLQSATPDLRLVCHLDNLTSINKTIRRIIRSNDRFLMVTICINNSIDLNNANSL